ncbi:MAG: hypothetical protein JO015_07315 [Verrucomicrobia bacterium]|nr:hypothetical protein [Verrucomicrobiota bacterium]
MRSPGGGRLWSHIVYSRPELEDQLGQDYDSAGRLKVALLDRLRVTRNGDFYLCGPPSFGVCHTCECALIGGAVDYHPSPLEPPSEGNLLICCSQPRGEVEIDLWPVLGVLGVADLRGDGHA